MSAGFRYRQTFQFPPVNAAYGQGFSVVAGRYFPRRIWPHALETTNTLRAHLSGTTDESLA